MFGWLVCSYGDGRDGIGAEADRLPAHRLIDCSQPNITCPGNRARGSIFPHPYSGKISTSSSNGRPGVYCNVLARGRTGSEHFSASILDIPVCNLVTLQIRRRTARCCLTTINLVLSWKFRDLQKKFHRAVPTCLTDDDLSRSDT